MGNLLVINPRLYIKIIISGIFIAVLISTVQISSFIFQECGYLHCLFIAGYGILYVEHIKYITPILTWIIPQVLLIYLLGNFLSECIHQNAVYIFTRSNKRKSWLLTQVSTLFVYVFSYSIVQFIVLLLIGYINNIKFPENYSQVESILLSMILVVMQNFIIILFINILSLYVSATNSIATFMFLHLGCIVLVWFINEFTPNLNSIINFVPFTQGIYSWHSDSVVLASKILEDGFRLSNYSLYFSIGYMIVFILIIIILGAKKLERIDFL